MNKWTYIGDMGLLYPGADIVEMMTRHKLKIEPVLWPRAWIRIKVAINDIVQDRTRNQILWELLDEPKME